ncbi:MAG: OmpA family protein [Sphingomicrobium sp.]
MRKTVMLVALALAATGAQAQILPFLSKRDAPPPVAQGIDALRADFAAQSGGTTVYYGAGNAILGPPAKAALTLQAAWIRRHPEVVVRIEGYGDTGDTRDHALAVGAQRAENARDYLVLLGVPAAQVSITSWGGERSGLGRAVTVLVR